MASQETIERLLHLNAEIATLARARVPIASELPRTARLLTGRESTLASRIKASMQAGASLDEALTSEEADIPAFYVAIVRAGLASNRLPAALEAFGVAYRRLANLRQTMAIALLYPLAVVFVACALLSFAVAELIPTYDWIGIGNTFFLRPLRGSSSSLLIQLIPLAVLASAVTVVFLHLRNNLLGSGIGLLGWLPGVRGAVRLSAYATYSWTLSVLVRNSIPLPTALELAAEATGWPKLSGPSRALAEHLSQGGALDNGVHLARRLPPLVHMSLLIAGTPTKLADTLESAAGEYSRRAHASADRVATYFPAAAVAIIGGATVSVYAYAMMQPYLASLVEMTTWHH